MTNRYPLIVDTSDSNKIKELPDGDNLQLSGNSIVGAVNITASGALTIGSVVAATSITIGGTAISSVATSGSYTDLTNTPTAVSTFTNDSNYVTTGSNVSVFANNAGYLTTVAYADLTSTPTTLAGYGITVATDSIIAAANSAIQPADNVSTLTNDSGYITLTQVQSGDISIDVTNSGDLIGSVFSQDSTLMVDAILSSFNLDGTIRGHVTPAQSEFWDLGTTDNLFRHAYLSGTVNANTAGVHTGDTIGSVFGDDSTVLVDGVANAIVGKIDSTAKIDVTTNSNVKATLTGNTNTGVTGPRIEFNTSDGTLESPTAVVSSTTGSSLGEMRGLGYDGTDYSEAGLVRVSVDLDQTVASGVVPGRIVFITANNAGSLANIMTFNSAGKLGIGTPRPDEKLHVIGNAKVDGFVQFGSLTTAERDALTAANGMVIYNTTDNKFQGYENSGWANLI